MAKAAAVKVHADEAHVVGDEVSGRSSVQVSGRSVLVGRSTSVAAGVVAVAVDAAMCGRRSCCCSKVRRCTATN